jgi:hypothetical protein
MHPQALATLSEWVSERERALNAAFDRLARAIADLPEEGE